MIYYNGIYKLLINDKICDVVVSDISVDIETGITLITVLVLNEFMVSHTFNSQEFISQLLNDD
ncbi:MAG: hypothetical protein KDH96_04460 [Candidatus Riesia sp.]|nr:hypothetical protein [Candidatus Riesia sp.]